MKTTEDAENLLNGPLDKNQIRERQVGGGSLAEYIPTVLVAANLNRNVGPLSWSREVKRLDLIEAVQVKTKKGTGWTALARAQVRVEIHTKNEQGLIQRAFHEDVGHLVCAPQITKWAAIEFAEKGAVTDAINRCLRYLGPQFGLTIRLPEDDRYAVEAMLLGAEAPPPPPSDEDQILAQLGMDALAQDAATEQAVVRPPEMLLFLGVHSAEGLARVFMLPTGDTPVHNTDATAIHKGLVSAFGPNATAWLMTHGAGGRAPGSPLALRHVAAIEATLRGIMDRDGNFDAFKAAMAGPVSPAQPLPAVQGEATSSAVQTTNHAEINSDAKFLADVLGPGNHKMAMDLAVMPENDRLTQLQARTIDAIASARAPAGTNPRDFALSLWSKVNFNPATDGLPTALQGKLFVSHIPNQ